MPLAVLAYPHPLFRHSQRLGEFAVFSSQPLPDDIEGVMEDVRTRIARMEYARPGAAVRVFLCATPRRYAIFTRLSGLSSDSMALGLSVFGNVFVNETKVRRMAETNRRGIRHCRFEGDLAATIAHEIAHFNVVDRLGFREARRVPFWKAEGYAEVQANLAAAHADASYDFRSRVDLLLDDVFWGASAPVARQLFEWHVLVEYLTEMKGNALEDIVDESVTQAAVKESMLDWYRAARRHETRSEAPAG